MLSKKEYLKSFLKRDRRLLKEDSTKKPVFGYGKKEVKIISDFTEYSPLHLGHKHCMEKAKEKIPEGIFVAVVPGPFERSGRGLPYIMTRHARAEAAIAVGADIVVEGPPMGIMGSGQYSLCLAKIFKALDADYIPRGYKPMEGFDRILHRISNGRGIAPKPYKIVDMETKEVLRKGELHEDNYVIVSLSKSLKKIGFDFRGKFIFIKRIKGVSGTKIRESIQSSQLNSLQEMLPCETIDILNEEMINERAPLNQIRDVDNILRRVNENSLGDIKSLALIDDRTAKSFMENRPFNNLYDLQNSISLTSCVEFSF